MGCTPLFIMLVGLPGSGKSTWAREWQKTNPDTVICSSDEIRKELFGDNTRETTSEENNKVFTLLHKRIKENLREGRDVIYDATNLNKRRRIAFLQELKNINCRTDCEVFLTEYPVCLERNAARERNVPCKVMERMFLNFQPPHDSEGWDIIWLNYGESEIGKYDMARFHREAMDFDQENTHHSLTLLDHSIKAMNEVSKRSITDSALTCAALYHDLGKLWTKTKDENGQAHYYQHHCVGAYNVFFYLKGSLSFTEEWTTHQADIDFLLQVSNLIYYHMHPYLSWKQSEKAKEADRKLLGDKMFSQIMLLHEADVAAH